MLVLIDRKNTKGLCALTAKKLVSISFLTETIPIKIGINGK